MSETAAHVASGKVRELYALDDERLLLVASDRISTFDVVLPTEIPDKGRVLTGLSAFWFARTAGDRPEPPARAARRRALDRVPRGSRCCRSSASCAATSPARAGRTTVATGEVCGHRLPDRPRRVGAAAGADLHARDEGADRATTRTSTAPRPSSSSARSASTRSSGSRSSSTGFVSDYAASRGIILADTKLEFGLDRAGRLVLGDEAFTPDSSRFWPADEYAPGARQPSFDKQFVRDYCESLGWDKTHPGPELPDDVVAGTRARYVEAFERLTGIAFAEYLARPGGGARDEGDRARPAEAGHPRPAGPGGRELAPPPRLRGRRGARRPARRRRARDRRRDEARAQLERMCEQLLANPLIESYEIELGRDTGDGVTDAGTARPVIAVVVFPGSNDDRDAQLALERLGADAPRVWHTDEASCRAGRQPSSSRAGSRTATTCAAARSHASRRHARGRSRSPPTGGLVLGICNGFQILTEAGLLPGALRPNESLSFVCRDVALARRAHGHAVHRRAARSGRR